MKPTDHRDDGADGAGVVGAGRRLALFVAGLLLLVGALELLVRRHDALFAGASHRMLAKVAVAERKPRVDFLFFGTSRTLEGVAPRLVARRLRELSPQLAGVAGFNAASTGSNTEDLLTLVPRYLRLPELRVVLIELSMPHFSNSPSLALPPAAAVRTLEERLAQGLQHVAFIRHRSAFISDNLGRLPALLLFSHALSGCETRGSEQIAAWLERAEPAPAGFDERLWQPAVISPGQPEAVLPAELEMQAVHWTRLAQAFAEKGVGVVFVVPPLTANHRPAPERETYPPLYRELVRRTGCEVWDFAAQPRPESFFKDTSHLTRKVGRAHWSYALAGQLKRKLETP